MLFFKLVGGIFAKIGIGLSLLFSPAAAPMPTSPTPLVLLPEKQGADIELSIAPELEEKPEPAEQKPVPSPAPKPSPQPPAPTIQTTPSIPASTPLPAPVALPPGSNLNDLARAALVNILCTTKTGGILKPISGSGVIVDERGIVLTNAHVAQFFLLRDYPIKDNVDCALRVGSPARLLYTAKLLFFPTAWMTANAQKIAQEVPTGTGEYDYAFLLITGRTDPAAALPTSFSYVPPSARTPNTGEEVLLAGYPAGFLDGQTVHTNLFITTAKTLIGEIFTFHQGGGSDLISISGTVLSQHGSSGGAVLAARDASLIGTIVTSTSGDTTANRDLRAITLRHMNKSYYAETGQTLDDLFSGDIRQKADAFNITAAPSLSRALVEELEK